MLPMSPAVVLSIMRRRKACLLPNMLQGERALAAFQQVCPAQLQPGITAFNMAISACAPGGVRPAQLHPGLCVCTAQPQHAMQFSKSRCVSGRCHGRDHHFAGGAACQSGPGAAAAAPCEAAGAAAGRSDIHRAAGAVCACWAESHSYASAQGAECLSCHMLNGSPGPA
jgi:hypothetical protein